MELISLGSDCLNVNTTIWNHIHTHMTDEHLRGLFPFILCNYLHVVYNVFCNGLAEFGL